MLNVTGAVLKALPVVGLEKLRDLEYFDGPFLSHFVHERGDHYLFYWCDCDSDVNRWMVLRVSETNIIRLVNKFIPLSHVIPLSCQDDFVYFSDIDGAGRTKRVILSLLHDIPPSYTPKKGAYLESAIPKDERTYPVLIEGTLSVEDLAEMPTRYSQAYSLIYALNELQPEGFVELPWRGGFSSMHFYRGLAGILPFEHRASVASLQYASPGFIRFFVHRPTADEVALRILEFSDRRSGVYMAFSSLRSYITENKLNDLREQQRDHLNEAWVKHNPILFSRTTTFLQEMKMRDPAILFNAVHAPFEAAKIALSLGYRLRELAGFQLAGIVRFPPS